MSTAEGLGSFRSPLHWPSEITIARLQDHVRKNGEIYRVVDISSDPENVGFELVKIQQIDWRTEKLMPQGMSEVDRRRSGPPTGA
jgi:hypothetical protein